jgi:zinc/manganese transport system permease protein
VSLLFDALGSPPVQVALVVGAAAALLCAVAGVFTVLRGQAFAGHALADAASSGGAAAMLLGWPPLAGYLLLGLTGVAGLEAFSSRRNSTDRDLAAGILLGAALGLTALLLFLDVTTRAVTGAAMTVMFGAIFALPASVAMGAGCAALGALALAGFLLRPLLLASVSADLATVAGVNIRLVNMLFLVLLALAVSLAALTMGAILATALLTGPAVAALRLVRRPLLAVVLAAVFGLAACWGGVLLAYASYGWTPGHVWPVSFFATAIVVAVYALSSLVRR